jgi:hypothetical protein
VSVVSAQARRRWSVVVCGIALLCALPAVIAALPVPAQSISAATLRARIMASASVPYQGYDESTVNLGLPELPDFSDLTTLFDGSVDQYVWYRSPASWRAAVITGTGENDTYQVGQSTYLWNYGHDVLTRVIGAEPVRLPRAPDLLAPALARRLLAIASPADTLSRLPSRRIAGVDAAGLRLAPAEPATTIGAIDIWADPATGLPLDVEVTGRGAAKPVLATTLLQVTERSPSAATVLPDPAPGVLVTSTALPNVDRVLGGDGDGDRDGTPFPAQLAGLGRIPIPGGLNAVAAYGAGLSRLVLVALPRGTGSEQLNAAVKAGAGTVSLPGGKAVLIRTPLLNVLMVHAGFRRETYLLTGAVTPALLESAGASLQAGTGRHR